MPKWGRVVIVYHHHFLSFKENILTTIGGNILTYIGTYTITAYSM